MSTIKANAVTGSTTNSDLALTGNGSGVVKIGDGALKFPDADGSTGQFIKTNGSAQLSFAAAGGGALSFISTATASNSASIDIDVTGVADSALLVVSGLVPATDDAVPWLRVSIDSDSSYAVGTSYTYGGRDNLNQGWNTGGAAQIICADTNSSTSFSNVAAEAGSFTIKMWNLKSTVIHPQFIIDSVWVEPDGVTSRRMWMSGIYDASADDVTHVRILMDSGNITSGRFTLYSLAES